MAGLLLIRSEADQFTPQARPDAARVFLSA